MPESQGTGTSSATDEQRFASTPSQISGRPTAASAAPTIAQSHQLLTKVM